ncbi:MAG: TRAP transporter TatT component family protein, partial [Gammaproteobacteria bacterium]|nr:TRAP transporter TatT component family protein [Gammaproteobacteria bacterium]
MPILSRCLILFAVISLTACSTNKFMVSASMPLLESGIVALNHETDLEMAKAAMPANISMLESMAVLDPDNLQLRTMGAQAYYAYSYSFIEDADRQRASSLYLKGLVHGEKGLINSGFTMSLRKMPYDDVVKLTEKLDKDSVPLMFWTASCMAKWIDMNRDKPAIVAQAAKTAVLIDRVLQLDETYYYGSAHLFFGAYYGSRPAMMGGNLKKSQFHFDRARAINAAQLLITDVLQAQY